MGDPKLAPPSEKTTAPPPEYEAGERAVDAACEAITADSDRVARVIAARRKSGRFLPPFPRRREASQPLPALVRVAWQARLAVEAPGRLQVGQPRGVDPPDDAPPLARAPRRVEGRAPRREVDR